MTDSGQIDNIDKLLELYRVNMIDYEKIKDQCKIVKKDSRSNTKIFVIIPVYDRDEHLNFFLKNIVRRIAESDVQIESVVVEYSPNAKYESWCQNSHYIHIPNDLIYIEEPNAHLDTEVWMKSIFNKCLAMNIGFLTFYKQDAHYIFHDVDCAMQKDFFNNCLKNLEKLNINNDKFQCLQTFCKRRIVSADRELSDAIISGQTDIDTIDLNTPGLKPDEPGAPGGSILVSSDLFLEVGGFDPELYRGYSPEDVVFWEKISRKTNIVFADDPPNELIHIYHEKRTNMVDECYVNFGFWCKLSPESRDKIILERKKNFDTLMELFGNR